MPFTDYTDLQASVASWLNRADLSSQIPDFIALAETNFARKLRYFATFVPLSGGSPVNEILTKAPDLYLFGSLLEAAPFLEDDTRIPVWQQKFTDALTALNNKRDWEASSTVDVLDNYADLQTALKRRLNRNDLENLVPMFIALTEVEIKRRLRRTTVRSLTYSVAAESNAPPADMAELQMIRLITGNPDLDKPLTIVSPIVLSEMRAQQGNAIGRPRWASVIGGQIVVTQPPDQTYTAEIIYFQSLTPLSNSNTTNTVLTEAPDAYFYGALLQAAPYLENTAMIEFWQEKFDNALNQLEVVREREEYAARPSGIRLPLVFG